MKDDGNLVGGIAKFQLVLCVQADALIGCFRFVEGYYLLFVTQKNLVGSICGTNLFMISYS